MYQTQWLHLLTTLYAHDAMSSIEDYSDFSDRIIDLIYGLTPRHNMCDDVGRCTLMSNTAPHDQAIVL